MKILFVSPYLPSEESGAAGAQLIHRVLSYLLQHDYKIHLLYLANPGDDHSSLTKSGIDVHAIPFYRDYTKSPKNIMKIFLKRIVSIFNSIINQTPYILEKYRHREITRKVVQIVKKYKIDIVQCEYNFIALNIPKNVHAKRILVEHDVTLKLFQRFRKYGRRIILRCMGFYQGRLWQNCEPVLCNNFDSIVTLTSDDKRELEKSGVHKKITVINPPISSVEIKDTVKKIDSVCFVGSFNRHPNIEAVFALVTVIWPKVSKKLKSVKLFIAGKNMPKKLIRLLNAEERIEYVGFVSDIDSFIASNLLFVAPLKLGSGFKMKITHSLSCGTPVITTRVGAEGINISEREGLFVRDNYNIMCKKIVDLLSDKKRLIHLGKVAKRVTNERFRIDIVGNKYERLYKNIR